LTFTAAASESTGYVARDLSGGDVRIKFWPLLTIGMSSCIFFKPPWLVDDEEESSEPDEGTGADTDVEDQEEVESPDPESLALYPSGGALGQTIVASLVQHDIDGAALSDIANVELYGPSSIVVVTLQHRTDDEVLVVLQIDEASELGMNDLHVFLDDGSDLWVNDVFEVVRRPSQAPQDYWPEPAEAVEDTDASDTDASDTDASDTDAG
jgi:hypothetical protein